uniref:Uncharacterized protein n=1 Tax=Vespula pensylvanica TaxID=30213 RepID=A0A834UER9_VESPE|nr:hypothetical protein H0235_002866 [Vespula pensylvanica]
MKRHLRAQQMTNDARSRDVSEATRKTRIARENPTGICLLRVKHKRGGGMSLPKTNKSHCQLRRTAPVARPFASTGCRFRSLSPADMVSGTFPATMERALSWLPRATRRNELELLDRLSILQSVATVVAAAVAAAVAATAAVGALLLCRSDVVMAGINGTDLPL